MKTSNIILFTLIGSITITIIAGAMQLRFTGERRSGYEELIIRHDLREFRNLVIRRSVNLAITPSEKTSLVILYAKHEKKPVVTFNQRGDTLFIDEIKFGPQSRTLSVSLEIPLKNLQWIKAHDAAFSLEDFSATFLHLDLNNSRLYIGGRNAVRMGTVEINAVNNSNIVGTNVKVDTLELELDQSELRMVDDISKLRGSMKNRASIYIPNVTDLELRKDSSSNWLH